MNYIDDVYNYYISYIYFYNNLRPHGSLNYFTTDFVFNIFSNQDFDSNEIKSIKFNDFIVCKCFPYFFSNIMGSDSSNILDLYKNYILPSKTFLNSLNHFSISSNAFISLN
ncbi:hypothetical protein JOC61_002235 [Marinitoga litoralis]|nr:hypothetical protein [Marinitoga litoralis]